MPTSDPAYIIGAIRHKEQGLLGADEYTRLIGAASSEEALHVLVDTPYGAWLDSTADSTQAFSALNQRLVSLQQWLTDVVEDDNLLGFIQLRYDALNLATALIEHHLGKSEPGPLSDLGSISPTTIHSLLWHNTGWELISEHWQKTLRSAKELLAKKVSAHWQTELLFFWQYQSLALADTLAATPLMRTLVTLNRDRLVLETLLRLRNIPSDPNLLLSPLAKNLKDDSSLADIALEMQRAGYSKFTEAMLASVRRHEDSQAYELAWDNYLIALLKTFSADPIGLDPILAFWLIHELEAKNIRLLLSAKLQGLSAEKIKTLQRNPYLLQ